MDATVVASLTALGGVVVGGLLSALTARWSHQRTMAAEDARRWLVDRRKLYAEYLAALEQAYRGERDLGSALKAFCSDIQLDAAEKVTAIFDRTTGQFTEIQILLSELQLLALPEVAELAERTAQALLKPLQKATTAFGDSVDAWGAAVDALEKNGGALAADVTALYAADVTALYDVVCEDFSGALDQIHQPLRALQDAMRLELGLPTLGRF